MLKVLEIVQIVLIVLTKPIMHKDKVHLKIHKKLCLKSLEPLLINWKFIKDHLKTGINISPKRYKQKSLNRKLMTYQAHCIDTSGFCQQPLICLVLIKHTQILDSRWQPQTQKQAEQLQNGIKTHSQQKRARRGRPATLLQGRRPQPSGGRPFSG